MRNSLSTIIFAISAAIASAPQSDGADSVFMAVDVSRSLDSKSWRTLTSRVAADVATLPEGTLMNVTTFGASAGMQPLFSGALESAGRERVIQSLSTLEPSEKWTFFQTAFIKAQGWFLATNADRQILIFYSDGRSSLPTKRLEDLPVLKAAEGTAPIDAPFKLFLWRPANRRYTILGGPAVEVAGAQLTTIEEVMSWRSLPEVRLATLQRLAEQSRRARLEIERSNLPRNFVDEFAPHELVSLAIALALAACSLLIVRTERFRNVSDGRLPEVLIRPLGRQLGFSLPHAHVELTDTDSLPEDPRNGPHLEIRPPNSLDDEVLLLRLPKSDSDQLTIGSKPMDTVRGYQCVSGIPASMAFNYQGGDAGALVLTNQSSEIIVLQTPHGNEFPVAPGAEAEVELDDVLVLPRNWSIVISPPRPQADTSRLLAVAS